MISLAMGAERLGTTQQAKAEKNPNTFRLIEKPIVYGQFAANKLENVPFDVLIDLDNELTRSYKWGKKFNSLHEAYAVLLEEVEEVWDVTKQKKNERNKEELYKELIQVAAMAIKTINSLENCVGDELGKS